MCTLTWRFTAGAPLSEVVGDVGGVAGAGYEVHFNRDERRTRRPASDPRVERLGGVPVILPTDADAGGTWIAVNAHGVTLTLLNGYRFMADPHGVPPPDARSRGLLVRDLADCVSGSAVAARLGEHELARYQPFTLVAFASDAPGRCFEWSGRRLEVRDLEDSDRPVCSSSFDQAGAERGRSGLWREMFSGGELRDPAGALARYHASHEPERGAASVCMHRADARTVSYSFVSVSPRGIRFEYVPGPPCSTSTRATLEIERSPAAVS